MAEFTAHYERKFSDGAYGSEGFALGMTLDMTLSDEQALTVGHRLRATVLAFLASSAARQVAYAAKHELEPHAAVPSAEPDSLEGLPF